MFALPHVLQLELSVL